MWLSELTIQNCRIINKATLKLSPSVNYIKGANGSGKTSLLEALSMLSYGRSFRTSRISDVIQHKKKSVIATASLVTELNNEQPIGIEKSTTKTIIRVNKQSIQSQSKLSMVLPFSIIHPLSHELITGGSSIRRSFIDWIAFYQYPHFHHLWKHYRALLKQRNAALKQPRLSYALDYLTVEMCKLQQPIHECRLNVLTQLKETMNIIIPESLSMFIPDFSLTTGLPNNIQLDRDELISFYKSSEAYEKKRGRTLKGVHVSDLEISLSDKPASSTASRGQAKILAILLNISQSLTITQHGLLAFDDLSAEIDKENYDKLLIFILGLNRQTFITSTNFEHVHSDTMNIDYKMFHVEHGSINIY